MPIDHGRNALISTITSGSNRFTSNIDHSSDTSLSSIAEMTRDVRRNECIQKDSKVFVAVAWANVNEIRMMTLFPEVFHCDATCDTNNTKNHLITLSGRTSTGSQFVFIRIWVVNQRRSMFKWVFSNVLPNFIPKHALNQVKFVMVDGDPQQESELVIAMKQYMPKAMLGKCSWHVITQGWNRRVPGCLSVPTELRDHFKIVTSTIKTWLYSFTREGYVENKDEMELSKKLLFAYLKSSTVRKVFNNHDYLINNLIEFCHDYVFIYAESIFFMYRKSQRHFNVSTNNPHEGTNFGAKAHAASVKPCHTIDNAGRSLSLQGELKVHSIESQVAKDVSEKCLWSNLPTSGYLTTYAEGIVHSIFERIPNYQCQFVSRFKWYVKHNVCSSIEDIRTVENINCPIPRFRRTRVVNCTDDGFLKCSCCHFERTGFGCVHIAVVIKHHFPLWNGYTHHDVSVRWWSSYIKSAFRPEFKALSNLFAAQMNNEILGPMIPSMEVIQNIPVCDTEVNIEERAADIVINYNKEFLMNIANESSDLFFRNATNYNGLSQEGHTCEESAILQELQNFDNIFDASIYNIENADVFDSREYLKHSFNELVGCLDSLKEKEWNHHVQDVICSLVNQSRSKLFDKKSKKRNFNELTVNIMSEEKKNSVKRKYASKNCLC